MRPKLTPHFLLRLGLEWLIGCVAVLGSMLCLCATFDLPVPPTLWLVVPLLMLLLCSLAQLQKADLVCALVGAVLMLLMLLLRKPLLRSAAALWNILGSMYAKGYENLRDYFPATLDLDYPATAGALLMIAALQTFFTAVSVSRWRLAWPVIPALLPTLAPCFVLRDTLPPLLPLMLTAGAVLVLVLSQNVRRRDLSETSLAFLWGGIVSVLLLGALLLFIPRRGYTPPITWEQLSAKMESWSEEQNNRGNAAAGLTGNPDAVELHDLRSLPNKPITVMEIRTDYRGRIYLRGSSYNHFNGSSWSRDKGPDRTPSLVFPTLLFYSIETYTLDVTPVSGEKLYYIPDGLRTLPEGAVLQGDACFPNPDPEVPYTVGFCGDPETSGYESLLPFLEPNDVYRRYVEEVCLELPEQTREGLLAWFRAQAGEAALSLSVPDKAALVEALVSAAVPYSREISRPPADRDFCLWFLQEAESGYCVHYATAAAALLRALGIPAQYVSGYICTPSSTGFAAVTTLQAHAWVEYYYANSWHRLEPTPGNATEFTGRISFLPEDSTSVSVEETLPPLPTKNEPTDTTALPPTETEPPRPSESEGPAVSESGTEPETVQAQPILPSLKWLWLPGGLIGLVILARTRRKLVRDYREHRFRKAAGNDLALLLYRRYKKLCRLLKTEPGEEATRLANKAAFSQHTLNAEELRQLRMEMYRAAADLNAAPPLKRLYYRWILAVI